jgi:RNA polymerase sigma-70 factor (ECF subfamily)
MQNVNQAYWDEVIEAVRAGDRDRFREIVSHFQDLLRFTVAFHIRGNAERIDEVVHMTFIKAFRSLGRFELGRPLEPWLKQIARHEAIREVKRMGREARRKTELIKVALAETRADDEAPIEKLKKLRECIGLLKGFARKLVDMHYFQRKTLKAIAAAVGRSAGGLRVTMLRVRQELKSCMEQ